MSLIRVVVAQKYKLSNFGGGVWSVYIFIYKNIKRKLWMKNFVQFIWMGYMITVFMPRNEVSVSLCLLELKQQNLSSN